MNPSDQTKPEQRTDTSHDIKENSQLLLQELKKVILNKEQPTCCTDNGQGQRCFSAVAADVNIN